MEPVTQSKSPLDTQVGGDFYKNLAIQPVEYIYANKLDFFQGSVVKYITRFRSKNGLEDLKKAKHFIDLLIQMEYTEPEEIKQLTDMIASAEKDLKDLATAKSGSNKQLTKPTAGRRKGKAQ